MKLAQCDINKALARPSEHLMAALMFYSILVVVHCCLFLFIFFI